MSALIDSALEVVGIKSSGAKTAAKSIGAVLLVLSILRRVVRSSPFIQDKIIRFMVRTQFRLNYRHALRWFALKDGTDVERDVEARKKQFAVVLVGTNSPLFHSSRAKICTAVVAGGKIWLVDTGPQSTHSMLKLRAPLSTVGGVFFTHYHSDHIGDLGEMNLQLWASGRKEPLDVWGPTGIDKLVNGFNMAYELDQVYRVDHHGPEVMPPTGAKMIPHSFACKDLEELVVHQDPETGLKITAFSVNHSPVEPAVGYKFYYHGRTILISGDCTAQSPALRKAAQNVDILVHEAQAHHMMPIIASAITELDKEMPHGLMKFQLQGTHIMHDILTYHTGPLECAEIANEANAKLLVMHHLIPAPPTRSSDFLFLRGMEGVRKKWQGGKETWVLGDDGMAWELPAAPSTEIKRFSL